MTAVNLTLKALCALISYPEREIKEASEEIRRAIRNEAAVPPSALRALERLIDELRDQDLYELQERYVFLFDRTRSLSLHLFEHVHGESRARGQAMIDLRTLYEEAGLDAVAGELPDYLPMFLEFLSFRPADEARALLGEPLGVIVALKERLMKRGSSYAAVFRALEALAAGEPPARELAQLREAPDDDPNDLGALDAAWEDEPVTFGPGEAGCPTAERMLKRMGGEAGGAPARKG